VRFEPFRSRGSWQSLTLVCCNLTIP
jgi:hypothetical protein